jgi:flagellar motor switch protein FliM
MSEVLEQNEIDALLHGVKSGAVDTAPRVAEEPGVAREYDFKTQSRVVSGRLPTLEAINERLARSLRLSVLGMTRKPPEISVVGVTTPRYAEYMPTLGVPTSMSVIRFAPLVGNGLLVFEASLVFALIDIYFGGSGREVKIESRDFTATENHIIEMLQQQVIAGIQSAWAPLIAAKIEVTGRETNPQFSNAIGGTEVVVVSRLRIDLDGRGGEFHLVLPYAMLEPLKDSLRAGMQSERPEREERWSQILRNELEESEVDLVTQLGSAQISVSALIDMRAGDIIPCNFDGRATVLADDIPLFWGELGQQRGRQVVKVNQMNVRKSGNSLDAFVRKSP